jgi:hypothetical protein
MQNDEEEIECYQFTEDEDDDDLIFKRLEEETDWKMDFVLRYDVDH